MKLLILGGTVFLGRHLVEAGRSRGHEVTLFHRGRSGADLFRDLEHLTGDRYGDLSALEGRAWDAVIDTCGYTPAAVRASAGALADGAGHYTFVSSVSVYAENPPEGGDEQAAVGSLSEDELQQAEQLAAESGASAPGLGAAYGPLKALCEQAAEDAMPGRVFHLRPGLIAGPHDYSDRFTWWLRRVARGGEVLAPGRPERRVRFIDVRDLAEWTVRMAEAGATGVYNAAGPVLGWTMAQVLEECRKASGSDARFTWVGEELLEAHEIGPWLELPLWLPEEYNGFFEVKSDRAIAAGLTFRPLAETARDTLAWDRASSFESTWEVGLDPAVERKLLRVQSQRP